ncbi:hypothetical protein FF1_021732 [Malus domestica]
MVNLRWEFRMCKLIGSLSTRYIPTLLEQPKGESPVLSNLKTNRSNMQQYINWKIKRALIIGGGIANFTDVAATFNGIIRALREKESKLKAARMHIFVRKGGPNYQTGLAKMSALGEELGVPLEVYGPEATMTEICKQAIECIVDEA